MISKERKAVIHLAKAQLAMSDEDYRALLQRVAGVRSSSELDDVGFDAVMAEFERLGFRSVKHRTPATRREGMANPVQIGKIRALWKAYSGADDELRLQRWLEIHFHVSGLRFLEGWRAGKAIAILYGMVRKKHEKRSAGQDLERGARQ